MLLRLLFSVFLLLLSQASVAQQSRTAMPSDVPRHALLLGPRYSPLSRHGLIP
jgi:hypothetical protein